MHALRVALGGASPENPGFPRNPLALCDFGHCMSLRDATTTDHRVHQTLFWRAPEMHWGGVPSFGADLWSLGVVLAQMWRWRDPVGHGEWLTTPMFMPDERHEIESGWEMSVLQRIVVRLGPPPLVWTPRSNLETSQKWRRFQTMLKDASPSPRLFPMFEDPKVRHLVDNFLKWPHRSRASASSAERSWSDGSQ